MTVVLGSTSAPLKVARRSVYSRPQKKGAEAHGFRHGKFGTRIYSCWSAMKKRCLNPRTRCFSDYGGRGITVCERWMEFANFYADMGDQPEGLSLDRIDNDRGYSPDNCRWATTKEQGNNRRTTPRIVAFGETKTFTDWLGDERCRVPRSTLFTRLNRGWRTEAAISTPPEDRSPKVTPEMAAEIRASTETTRVLSARLGIGRRTVDFYRRGR